MRLLRTIRLWVRVWRGMMIRGFIGPLFGFHLCVCFLGSRVGGGLYFVLGGGKRRGPSSESTPSGLYLRTWW